MTDPDLDDTTEYVSLDERMHAAARAEVASLCGLVLRRLQDQHPTRSFERNAALDAVHDTMSRIFGEALAQFGDDQPGADG